MWRAEDHVGEPGQERVGEVAVTAAQHQIVDAVAVEVAGAVYGDTGIARDVRDRVDGEAIVAVERGEIDAAGGADVGAAEQARRRARSRSFRSCTFGAPTIRSSYPSPLTSPVALMACAQLSLGSTPSMAKPLRPSSVARSTTPSWPIAAFPNTT